MRTFKQFLEARGDANQMRNLGLTRGMRIKTPRAAMRHPDEEEIRASHYLVVNAPSSAPPEIRELNGKVVQNDEIGGYQGHYEGEVWISSLKGRGEEGVSRRVPIAWVHPATEEEAEHGKFLGNTFFHRDQYISPEERSGYINLKNNRGVIGKKDDVILHDALKALREIRPDMVRALETDEINKLRWLIAADALDDEGQYDTTELRALLARQ